MGGFAGVSRGTAVLAAVLLATGCGRSPEGARFRPSHVRLWSDPGDPVGAGQTYAYTLADAQISVIAAGGHLSDRKSVG